MSLAIVPGSFDPMTLGHLDLVREAAKRYDEVVVAVMINAEKEYLFDMKERIQMAELTVSELPNVRVIGDSGMLIDLFDRLHATVVFKSYRNQSDLEYETSMADWNREHNPRFVTELIEAKGERACLSATQVRSAMKNREIPTNDVHPLILPILRAKINEWSKSAL